MALVAAAVDEAVAPFTGAWIEIRSHNMTKQIDIVAPFTGAWIEIGCGFVSYLDRMSLPSRERGLKFVPGGHRVYP